DGGQRLLGMATYEDAAAAVQDALDTSGAAGSEFREVAVVARGIADAARLLSSHYTLVITNVPYRKGAELAPRLRAYLQSHYQEGAENLATAFLLRLKEMSAPGGTQACVTLSTWLYL